MSTVVDISVLYLSELWAVIYKVHWHCVQKQEAGVVFIEGEHY